jgi:transcriptional regulator with XRE-family HTH domain
MLSKDELLKYPDYLLTKYQLEIYRQMVKYMQEKNLSKGDLAKQMNVSNPYISQILNGNFNYTLKKLIEIGLQIGQVPMLSFIPVEQFQIESTSPTNQSHVQAQTSNSNANFLALQNNINGYAKSKPVLFEPKMEVVSIDIKQNLEAA